jgi:hypothetical protein
VQPCKRFMLRDELLGISVMWTGPNVSPTLRTYATDDDKRSATHGAVLYNKPLPDPEEGSPWSQFDSAMQAVHCCNHV